MDTGVLVSTLQESLFAISVFVVLLLYAMAKGRQGLVNVIMGLYFALLISLNFPYYDVIISQAASAKTEAILKIAVFVGFALLSTYLFAKLIENEYTERVFESFINKLAFTFAATALVMAFSYQVLPITELIDPGSPMQQLFAPEEWFFWWLILPLVVMFFL